MHEYTFVVKPVEHHLFLAQHPGNFKLMDKPVSVGSSPDI